MSDEEAWSFISGFTLGIIVLTIIIFIATSFWGSTTSLYLDGYYEAYKQFKQDKLEQSAPKNIKLKYDTELLKEKYK